MFSVEKSVVIRRPIEEVFRYASQNIPDWQASVVSAYLVPEGPLAVGSTQVIIRKMFGRKVNHPHEFTVVDPPHKICYRAPLGSLDSQGCTAFAPEEGGIRVTVSVEFQPRGLLKLVQWLIQWQLPKQIEADFRRLKSLLEARGT